MSIDVVTQEPDHRGRRWLARGTVAGFGLGLCAVLLALTTGSSAGAVPDVGAGTPLTSDITLAQLLEELQGDDVVADLDIGAGSTFAGAFDTDEYAALQLAADGSEWIYNEDDLAFSATATGTFATDLDTTASFQVFVHAVAHDAPATPSLVVLLEATNSASGTDLPLHDLVPVLRGEKPAVIARAGQVDAPLFGLSHFQGETPIDVATLPSGAVDFVEASLNVADLGDKIGGPDVADDKVRVSGMVNPRRVLLADFDMIGAAGSTADLTGVLAGSFPEFAKFRSPSATALDLGALDLNYTLPASVPTWTPEGWLTMHDDGDPDTDPTAWTINTKYDELLARLESVAQGPEWDIHLPVVFPDGTTFSPNFMISDVLADPLQSKQTVVGGTIGNWVPEGRDDITVSVSANFSKQGSEKFADFYVEATLPNADPLNPTPVNANGDLFLTHGSGEWSATLSLGFDTAFSVDRIQNIFGGSDPESGSGVPDDLLSASVEDLRIVLSIASGGTDDSVEPPKKNPPVGSVGVTGKVMVSPFTEPGEPVPEAIEGGASLMFFSSFGGGDTPTIMFGVAPSFRRIGGDDPASEPVYLSEVLGQPVDPNSDLKVYDPERPDTGFGLIYSSKTANIGGTPDADRLETPVNVAQWLMPMFGFDGSDEALDASTSVGSAGCGECSFRADFAPTKRFVVPGQGLTAAGSLIMPNPIGTRLDWAGSCADPDSDACQSALGFLGQLSLDSRVTLSGTFPLGIAPGAPPALGLELKISMRNDLPVERPTWLNDGRFSLSLKVDPAASKVKLGLSATLQIAIKQGLSPEDAADLFPGDPEAIIDHMLPAVAEDADCARSGVTLVETSSEGGFQEGSFYCHDLLEGTITANLSISPTSVEVKLLGDLKAVKLIDDDGPKDLSNTEPDTVNGWQPVGMDKFQINQLTIELGFKTGPTGFSATFGAGASVSILTTPRITASAAISLEFTPATVVLQGFRVNIGQLTLANVIEIYEWISNEDVPTDDLPGIALRNLALSIGFQDLPNLCINNGFYLSGDLYVSDNFDAFNDDPPAYQCNNTPGPGYGKLIPSPEEPCDQADIALGCVAGIRLLVNDRGVFGDAFIAAFDAGPLHLYDPTPAVDDGDPNTDDAPGRAVSVTFKITSSGVKIDVFGGAALGGTKDPTSCSDGQYCDAWAKGELTARIRANILNGVDVKVFGRVKSGLPGLSFQVIAAGEVHLQGATALVNLFTKGEIPQGSLMLHVELANADPAPDLDFAGAAQAEVDRAFGNALAALSDAARVIELLESDPSAAMDILDDYVADAQSRGITVDPALIGLIKTVDDILAAAESAGQSTNLDWLLKGFYFPSIPPGVPNLGDVFLGVSPPRCDGLNYGYGPNGTDLPQAAGYPYDYCFLYPTGYTDGICDGVGIPDAECTLQKVAEVLVVRPMLELVLAGVDVSSEVVGFAHDVTTMVLEGELFRIDCASFDLTAEVAGTIGAPDFFGEIQLGLFLTFFGQPIGISFEWFVDTEQDGLEQFGENIENLVNSLLETFTGTTESTCWTEEEIDAFIEDDTDDPTETGTPPPPPPAVMQSAEITSDAVLNPALGANVTREADTSTLTVTFDGAVATERALNVDWGDGSAVQSITIAAGSATVSATHVYVDDNPTVTPSDVRTAVITDTSNSQVLNRAVTVLNIAPSGVTINPTALSINENQSVGVTVSFTDPGSADSHKAVVEWAPGVTTSVTVPAGARSVVVSPYQFLQNPISQKALIKATVTDDDSGAGHGSKEIDVKNVAPEITETAVLGTDPVRESIARNYRISWTDPGTLDGHAVHVKWNWDGVDETTAVPIVWDEVWLVKDGKLYDFKQPINKDTVGIPLSPGLVRSLTLAHTYVDDTPSGTPADNFRPLVRIVDLPDATRDTEDVIIPVNDVAPVVSRDVATQTRQYSDKLADVTVTASDINGDLLTATTRFSKDAGAATAGLPAGVALGDKSCTTDATTGRQTCTWKLTGTAGVAAGTYAITVKISDEDTLFDEVTTTLVVVPEDAVVRFDPTNPIDIRVTAPGSNASKPFILKLMVEEKEPDLPAEWAAPGDISKAVVTVKLIPIGPGLTVPATCTRAVTGTGYAQVLTLTCPFANVPVNTYYVDVKVDGGFYAGGDEDVVNVSDPSLGFTAGGGWFYWPGTTDRTTFGYTMKYTKKLTNVQGSLVMIRHLADGTSYRVKSNSISGLAIGKGTGFNWASFTGKNTYRDRTWADPLGNYTFNAYVEDWGEPGTKDRFWIEVKDKDRQLVAVISIGRTATVGAVTLNGGNIQAPLPSSIA